MYPLGIVKNTPLFEQSCEYLFICSFMSFLTLKYNFIIQGNIYICIL